MRTKNATVRSSNSVRQQRTARGIARPSASSSKRSPRNVVRRALASPGVSALPFRSFRRNKFRAVPTVVDGIRFASKKEARYYGVLKARAAAGEIRDLVLQPSYDLHSCRVVSGPINLEVVSESRVCRYVADFRYFDNTDQREHVVDVKGRRLPIYNLKKKMMAAEHGIAIEEV